MRIFVWAALLGMALLGIQTGEAQDYTTHTPWSQTITTANAGTVTVNFTFFAGNEVAGQSNPVSVSTVVGDGPSVLTATDSSGNTVASLSVTTKTTSSTGSITLSGSGTSASVPGISWGDSTATTNSTFSTNNSTITVGSGNAISLNSALVSSEESPIVYTANSWASFSGTFTFYVPAAGNYTLASSGAINSVRDDFTVDKTMDYPVIVSQWTGAMLMNSYTLPANTLPMGKITASTAAGGANGVVLSWSVQTPN